MDAVMHTVCCGLFRPIQSSKKVLSNVFVTWGGAFVKNIIITVLNLLFDASVHIDYYTAPFTKIKMAAKSAGTAETGCKSSFHHLQFSSKYDCLHHVNIKSSAIWLVISNLRSLTRMSLRTHCMEVNIHTSILLPFACDPKRNCHHTVVQDGWELRSK